jgi:hypothetical protein
MYQGGWTLKQHNTNKEMLYDVFLSLRIPLKESARCDYGLSLPNCDNYILLLTPSEGQRLESNQELLVAEIRVTLSAEYS